MILPGAIIQLLRLSDKDLFMTFNQVKDNVSAGRLDLNNP
jgi:hypothetical protein